MSPTDPSAATDPSIGGPTLIGSVRRAMRLLEVVAEDPAGATAKHLARRTDIPIATAYHLLRTLTHDGYLQRDGGRYLISDATARLGSAVSRQDSLGDLHHWLDTLRDSIGAAVYYALYDEGEVKVVGQSSGRGAPAADEWADFRRTAHAHAIGQCLLSQLDHDGLLDHLSRHPVERLTSATVADADALMRKLSRIPRGMPVLEREEYAPGIVCGAVPISVGSVPAALAFSLPMSRAHLLDSLADRLRRQTEAAFVSLAFTVRA
ncbi:helix-turn-helix domain-containing protein [Streptomyces sp. NPDC006482]|uniref:IclR family transcriptional regulator n=1 Tax=Streptomyces sp. NPDC006482 TaxID=3154306 RepID=UPI0033A16119